MSETKEKKDESDLSALLVGLPLFKTMDAAIDAAAKHLPVNCVIAIKVERHGYSVTLEDTNGDEVDLDGGDGMRSDVYAGIMQANNLPY
jgi:hypothetical protein